MFAKGDNYSASRRTASSHGGARERDRERAESVSSEASLSSLSTAAAKKAKKATFGLDLAELRRWNAERISQALGTETAQQAIAVSKVKSFLDGVLTVVHIQSWWRMIRVRREYLRIINERLALKRKCYRSWKIYYRSEQMFTFHSFGKFFLAWRDEVSDEKRLKKTIAGFFNICIKRMKLTPQAIMAFFNPGEWASYVKEDDRMKIRRMVLLKLFHGWRAESHDLKIMRYKASQILSRMMRRSKGPLWVKESTLVCFHMWHRYTVIKNTYRRGEVDPNFKNPFLPQWSKLYKEMTLARVKKQRTLERGHLLTQRRAYRKWAYLMTVDRSKPVTPLAVAINHYITVLTSKVLLAWYRHVRARGRAMRFAEKIFYAWQAWAPKHRKLREFNTLAVEWVRIQRVRRAFAVMSTICHSMISGRTARIKELRRNFCDRKVMLCTYALLNKDEHVLFVDCWRRLVCFYKARRRWKVLQWQFNDAWFVNKAREILRAWRNLVRFNRQRKRTLAREKTLRDAQKPGLLAQSDGDAFPLTQTQAQVEEDNASLVSLETLDDGVSIMSEESISLCDEDSYTARLFATLSGRITDTHTGKHKHLGHDDTGDTISQADTSETDKTRKPPKSSKNYPYHEESPKGGRSVLSGLWRTAELLVYHARHDALPMRPEARQFYLLCQLWSRYFPQTERFANMSSEDFSREVLNDKLAYSNVKSQMKITSEGIVMEEKHEKTAEELRNEEVYDHCSLRRKVVYNAVFKNMWDEELQRATQRALTTALLPKVIPFFAKQPLAELEFLSDALPQMGDHSLALCALLLSHSTAFLAQRVVHQDKNAILRRVHHPINAFVLGSQIARWEKRDLTMRELSSLTQEAFLREMNGSRFQTILLWKLVFCDFLYHRCEERARACASLPLSRTMDEEVAEVIKRQQVKKALSVYFAIAVNLGVPPEWDVESQAERLLPDLLMKGPKPTIFTANREDVLRFKSPTVEGVQQRNTFYRVLREYLLLTGKLAREAKALRVPLMERDHNLLVSGFLRQTHADYLALRRERMLPSEIERETERKRLEEEREQKQMHKQEAKVKAKRKARKLKKKKKLKEKKTAADVLTQLPALLAQPADSNDNDSDDDKENETETETEAESERDTDVEDNDMEDTLTNALTGPDGSPAVVPFTERSFDKTRTALVRELFSSLALSLGGAEETEVQRERDFQERVHYLESPVYLETWRPSLWRTHGQMTTSSKEKFKEHKASTHDHVDVAQNNAVRLQEELRLTLQRIFFVIQHPDALGSLNYTQIRRAYPGLGMYIVDRVLSEMDVLHNTDQGVEMGKYRRCPLWLVLPGDYWSFRNVRDRVYREQAVTDDGVRRLCVLLEDAEQANDAQDAEVSILDKYLKKLRLEVVAIARKQTEKTRTDAQVRAQQKESVRRREKERDKERDAVHALNERLTRCETLLHNGLFSEVVQECGTGKEDAENNKKDKKGLKNNAKNASSPSKGKNKKDKKHANTEGDGKNNANLAQEAEEAFAHLREELDTRTEKLRRAEEVLSRTNEETRTTEFYLGRTSSLLHSLALQRFEEVLAVHARAHRLTHSLQSEEVQTREWRRLRRFGSAYLRALAHYLEHVVIARGQQLTRDAEAKRFKELLNRPASPYTDTQTEANVHTTTNTPHNTVLHTPHNTQSRATTATPPRSRPQSAQHTKANSNAHKTKSKNAKGKPSSAAPKSPKKILKNAKGDHTEKKHAKAAKKKATFDSTSSDKAENEEGEEGEETEREELEEDVSEKVLSASEGASERESEKESDRESEREDEEVCESDVKESDTPHTLSQPLTPATQTSFSESAHLQTPVCTQPPLTPLTPFTAFSHSNNAPPPDDLSLPQTPALLIPHSAPSQPNLAALDNELVSNTQPSSPTHTLTDSRPLTLDEEIALLHYNSPEATLQREEELRRVQEMAKEEARTQEQRLRLFDDYWASFPRRETDSDGERDSEGESESESVTVRESVSGSYSKASKKSNKSSKRGPASVVSGSSSIVSAGSSLSSKQDSLKRRTIVSRTERQWRSIGLAYWRDREQHVHALIQQHADLSGLDPESLLSVVMRKTAKTDIDPLDLEFDLLPDILEYAFPGGEVENEEVKRKKNKRTRFVEPFNDLTDSVWLVPEVNTIALSAMPNAAGGTATNTHTHTQPSRPNSPADPLLHVPLSVSVSLPGTHSHPHTHPQTQTHIAESLFDPLNPTPLNAHTQSSGKPSVDNHNFVSPAETALLHFDGTDPALRNTRQDRSKPGHKSSDVFALCGVREFARVRAGQRERKGPSHDGRYSYNENAGDDRSHTSHASHTTQRSLAGYSTYTSLGGSLTLSDDRSDSSTLREVRLEREKERRRNRARPMQQEKLREKRERKRLARAQGLIPPQGETDTQTDTQADRDAQDSQREPVSEDEDDREDSYEEHDSSPSEGDFAEDDALWDEEDDEEREHHSHVSQLSPHTAHSHNSSFEHHQQVEHYLHLLDNEEAHGGGNSGENNENNDENDDKVSGQFERSKSSKSMRGPLGEEDDALTTPSHTPLSLSRQSSMRRSQRLAHAHRLNGSSRKQTYSSTTGKDLLQATLLLTQTQKLQKQTSQSALAQAQSESESSQKLSKVKQRVMSKISAIVALSGKSKRSLSPAAEDTTVEQGGARSGSATPAHLRSRTSSAVFEGTAEEVAGVQAEDSLQYSSASSHTQRALSPSDLLTRSLSVNSSLNRLLNASIQDSQHAARLDPLSHTQPHTPYTSLSQISLSSQSSVGDVCVAVRQPDGKWKLRPTHAVRPAALLALTQQQRVRGSSEDVSALVLEGRALGPRDNTENEEVSLGDESLDTEIIRNFRLVDTLGLSDNMTDSIHSDPSISNAQNVYNAHRDRDGAHTDLRSLVEELHAQRRERERSVDDEAKRTRTRSPSPISFFPANFRQNNAQEPSPSSLPPAQHKTEPSQSSSKQVSFAKRAPHLKHLQKAIAFYDDSQGNTPTSPLSPRSQKYALSNAPTRTQSTENTENTQRVLFSHSESESEKLHIVGAHIDASQRAPSHTHTLSLPTPLHEERLSHTKPEAHTAPSAHKREPMLLSEFRDTLSDGDLMSESAHSHYTEEPVVPREISDQELNALGEQLREYMQSREKVVAERKLARSLSPTQHITRPPMRESLALALRVATDAVTNVHLSPLPRSPTSPLTRSPTHHTDTLASLAVLSPQKHTESSVHWFEPTQNSSPDARNTRSVRVDVIQHDPLTHSHTVTTDSPPQTPQKLRSLFDDRSQRALTSRVVLRAKSLSQPHTQPTDAPPVPTDYTRVPRITQRSPVAKSSRDVYEQATQALSETALCGQTLSLAERETERDGDESVVSQSSAQSRVPPLIISPTHDTHTQASPHTPGTQRKTPSQTQRTHAQRSAPALHQPKTRSPSHSHTTQRAHTTVHKLTPSARGNSSTALRIINEIAGGLYSVSNAPASDANSHANTTRDTTTESLIQDSTLTAEIPTETLIHSHQGTHTRPHSTDDKAATGEAPHTTHGSVTPAHREDNDATPFSPHSSTSLSHNIISQDSLPLGAAVHTPSRAHSHTYSVASNSECVLSAPQLIPSAPWDHLSLTEDPPGKHTLTDSQTLFLSPTNPHTAESARENPLYRFDRSRGKTLPAIERDDVEGLVVCGKVVRAVKPQERMRDFEEDKYYGGVETVRERERAEEMLMLQSDDKEEETNVLCENEQERVCEGESERENECVNESDVENEMHAELRDLLRDLSDAHQTVQRDTLPLSVLTHTETPDTPLTPPTQPTEPVRRKPRLVTSQSTSALPHSAVAQQPRQTAPLPTRALVSSAEFAFPSSFLSVSAGKLPATTNSSSGNNNSSMLVSNASKNPFHGVKKRKRANIHAPLPPLLQLSQTATKESERESEQLSASMPVVAKISPSLGAAVAVAGLNKKTTAKLFHPSSAPAAAPASVPAAQKEKNNFAKTLDPSLQGAREAYLQMMRDASLSSLSRTSASHRTEKK